MSALQMMVDPTRCAGHGICCLLFRERIDLDDWGYAAVDPAPFEDQRLTKKALRAMKACPEGALAVEPV